MSRNRANKRTKHEELYNHDDNPVLASVFELSSNRKRVRWDTTQVQTAAPSAGPSTIPGVEAPEYLPEDSQIPYEETPVHDSGEDHPPPSVQVRAKRYLNSVSPPILNYDHLFIQHRTTHFYPGFLSGRNLWTSFCDTREGARRICIKNALDVLLLRQPFDAKIVLANSSGVKIA